MHNAYIVNNFQESIGNLSNYEFEELPAYMLFKLFFEYKFYKAKC